MKIMSLAGLGLCLVSVAPQASHAEWDYHRHHDWGRGQHAGFFGGGLVLGAVLASLPQEHTTVVVAGSPYYYCNGVYYQACPSGYMIVNPPVVVAPPQVVMAPVVAPPAPAMSASTSFYRLGHDWARDLRDDVATRDQFIHYLRSNVLRLASVAAGDVEEFRRGFVGAYEVNGDTAFDKALQAARKD